MTVRHVDLQIEIFSSKSHRLSPVGVERTAQRWQLEETRGCDRNGWRISKATASHKVDIVIALARACLGAVTLCGAAEPRHHLRRNFWHTQDLQHQGSTPAATLDRGVARTACESMFQLRLRSRNNSHETRRQDSVFRISRGVSGQASSGRWTSSADDNAKNNHAHPRTRGAGKSRKG